MAEVDGVLPDVSLTANGEGFRETPTVDENSYSQEPTESIGDKSKEGNRRKENGEHSEGGGDATTCNEVKDEAKEDDDDDEWMDILGNGLLKKRVLRPGKGQDTRPTRGQLVYLKTKGTLDDGKEVEINEEICFHVGEGDVIQAWDMVVCLMELGEVAELVTDARYAYEELGRKPDIPSGAGITYEIELLKIEDPLDIPNLTMEERFLWGDRKRERGNDLYSRKDYSGAITSYTRALKILNIEEGGHGKEDYNELCQAGIKCYNNLAAAQLKVKAFEAAMKSCNNVLNIEPNNVKALFRKGKVFGCQREFPEAIKFMKDASKLEPSNKTIHQELSKTIKLYREELNNEKDLYKRMVGDMGRTSNNSEVSQKNSINYFKWGLIFSATLVAVGGAALAFTLNTR